MPSTKTKQLAIQILAVWASLLSYSFVRSPVPAINEPHYLTKARHFVEPEWCDRDLFVSSRDAHVVFLQLMGPIAQHSLLTAAITGRLVGYLVLAVGWVLLLNCYLHDRWACVLSLWVLMVIVTIGNFSGEWIIGGIESKIPAFGFALASLALLINRHSITAHCCAGCLAGLAVSLHPVVGGWNIVAIGLVLVTARVIEKRPIPFGSLSAFGIGSIVCSLPGLIPALRLVTVKSEHSQTANFIQVFGRLRHHLDPMDFPVQSWVMYLILGITFVALLRLQRRNENAPDKFWNNQNNVLLRNYIIATLLIALVGLAIGFGPRPAGKMPYYEIRAALLKFYPFRLFDIALPIAVSILMVGVFSKLFAEKSTIFRRRIVIALAVAVITTLIAPNKDRYPGRMSRAKRTDWLEACAWANANIRSDAVVLTPSRSFAFKWYAQRAEFVNYKDCPQDADGIMEWNTRLGQIHDWASDQYDDRKYSAGDLNILKDQYGITHLLVDHLGPMSMAPDFENRFYRLYEIRD